MSAFRQRCAMLLLAAGLLPAATRAQDAVLTPPDGWFDAGTDTPVDCPEGQQPQMTSREYRRFAERNQVWPQVSINEVDWRAGKVTKKPALRYPEGVAGLPGRVRVVIHVLVGEKGVPLDSVVTCSNAPELSQGFLGLVDQFAFRPTLYRKRDLVTIMPIDIVLER